MFSGRGQAVSQLTQSPRKGLQSEAEVLDFAGRSVGAIDVNTDISRPGSTHRVSLLTTRAGDQLVAKWFADSSSYFHTFDALSHYTKPLGTSAPKLIDQHDGLKVILMTALLGKVPDTDQARDPVVHFHIGQLMRQFHESAPTTTSTQVAKDLATELSRLIDQTEDGLGVGGTAELRALGMDVLDLGALTLHPVHGGLRPEHWMCDGNYGTQLFSFSASEYDPWIVDTVFLERDYWAYAPELRRAFFSGYDAAPSEADLTILRARQSAQALSTWVRLTRGSSTKKSRSIAWSHVEQALGGTLF